MARIQKLGMLVAAGAIAASTITISSASASPPDADGDHKVTICHVTNSAKNPMVVITVDVAAFDGHGRNDHTHHVSKDGRTDQLAVDGECVADPAPAPSPAASPVPSPSP